MRESESTFAGYQLQRLIEHDAVSATYRAVTPTDRGDLTVALQISQPLAGIDHARIESARRKADMIREIDHPGIARVLDTGVLDDRLFLATAWRHSISLGQLLDQRWRMKATDALTLLSPLAEGLDTTHQAGVVHGALSTNTIRVTSADATDGQHAFLTGFGVGDLLALRVGSRRQRDQEPALDDLLYVAPEQLRADGLSAATDQYALACALYHCVTGQPPFVRETASALFGAHLFAQPPVADLPPDDTGPPLRERLIIGLAKLPQERHPSCIELIGTPPVVHTSPSTGLLGGDRHPVAARPGRARTSTPVRLPTQIIPLLALAFVAIFAALTVVLLRDAGDTTAAALTDAPRAASAVGPSEAVSAPASETAPEPEPAAAVEWDTAVATTRISSVTPADDHLIVLAEDQVAALDLATGVPRWQEPIANGDATDAVVTDDVVAYRSSVLRAIGLADGRRRWTRDDELVPTKSLTGGPDGLFYGAGPGQGLFEIVAIEAATGDERWHFHGENGTSISDEARIAVDEDLVVIVEPGLLLALDAGGERVTTSLGRREAAGSVWRTEGIDAWLSTLLLTDDAVVLATRDGMICSHGRDDGLQRWCRPVPGDADRRPTVLADDGRLIVTTRSKVVALNAANGAPLWDAPTESEITAVDAAPDTIIVGEATGTVRAFDANSGEQQWALPDQGRIVSLALTADAAYAGRRDGTVARLRPPTAD